MGPVITITFSPCIDKSTVVRELIPEKKLKCVQPVLEPGGGGINVARALTRLGGTATACYLAGGYHGKLLTQLLKDEQVPVQVIETASDTRENWVVVEESTNNQYRFGMPGPVIKDTEWKELLLKIEQGGDLPFMVVSGSVTKGIPDDIFERIGAIAARRQAKLVVDTSGEALERALHYGVYMIKPSKNELASLVETFSLDDQSISAAAQDIINKGYAEVVVVSLGGDGVLFASKDMVKSFCPPEVNKVSTVGAGDSMVAGIVLSLLHHKDLEYAIKYGVACGSAAIMNPGTALCKPEDVEKIFPLVREQHRDFHF